MVENEQVEETIAAGNPDHHTLSRRAYRGAVRLASYYKSQITQVMTRLSREYGLPGTAKFSHFDVLCELYHGGTGSSTPTEIAAAIEVALPNVSTAIAELEALGLVERVSDPHDRRRAVVRFTELGQRFSASIVEGISEWVEVFSRGIDLEVLCEQFDRFDAAVNKGSR